MLRNNFDRILGTTSKVRILRLLCSQDRQFSARELTRLTDMSLPAVLKSIADLEADGVLVKETSGGQFLCRINREHEFVRRALQPLFQTERAVADEVLSAIRGALVKPKPLAAWVFGSVARGDERPGSDLDLFVLTARESDAEALEDAMLDELRPWRKRFGYKVSPLAMTLERALSQAKAGSPMIRNAVADARVLIGEIPLSLLEAAEKPHDAKNKTSPHR